MKVLFICKGDSPDYLSDMTLHGGRSILGDNFIDINKPWYMYKSHPELLSKIYGRGFTIYGHLDDIKINRNDIQEKIESKYFDLIIYGSIHREQSYLNLVLKNYKKEQIIFIDGEDHQLLFQDLIGKGKYFKRELNHKTTNDLFPINFSIPENLVVDSIPEKAKLFATVIPGNINTYIFYEEKDYFQDYQSSYFGLTTNKVGWDCCRHYEILMNGCIPYFPQLEKCPEQTMVLFPKPLILETNKLVESGSIDIDKYNDYCNKLLNLTRNNLTTKRIFNYILETIANKQQAQVYIMENDMSNSDINSFVKKTSQPPLKVRPFSEIPQYYRHVRREIVTVVPTDALNILDVGCGAGMLGKALKEQNPRRRVVGIELNDEAFYYAKINIDQVYHAELEPFEPPFSQGEFDCIIFADILEHLKDPWTIARRYATFLKPEGVMVVSIPNIRHLPTLRQIAELGSWKYQDEGILDRTHLRFFTKKDFIELLNQANIECDSVFYLGGQELHSLRPQEPERIVKMGNFALLNVSEEDYLELCAYQLLFVGIHKLKNNFSRKAQTHQGTDKLRLQTQGKVNLVSLVVPWWDHSELLGLWKRNLEKLGDVEIIFIDNGSASQAKLELQEFCAQHNIRLLRNEENRGFSAANNQGADVATGEYILHINNDVEIQHFPVEYLCDLAGDGIAGPGPVQTEIGEIYVEGWALCIKKSTLQALGGWCEDYGPGYWDDVDLRHRAKLAGYSVKPIPDIHKWIRHQGNTTGRDGRIDQLPLHIRNRKIFIKKHYSLQPKIVIDGVFFQLYKTGIARVWKSLFEEWADNGFAKHIVVLDRAGTAPKVPGIRYRLVPPYDYSGTDGDREMLQQVCDEEGADLFISTYYTSPLSTPSAFMAYDMIPEVMGWDLNHPMWREKHYAIQHASAYMAISENTARDLVKFFPQISSESVTVALCGVKRSFLPASLEEVNSFRTKYGISKPYFIVVGTGGYKNTILFFQAFAQLYSRGGFEIVCTGSGSILEAEFRSYTSGSVVHMLQLSDEELKAAYSGAVALVYPSKYEGFGLPVLEAIACGCPVITCPNASIPEVAGEAALYVNDDDVDGLTDALCDVQKPNVRNSLIAAGLEQAKKFSWSKMAKTVSSALIEATLLPLNLKDINLIVFPDWSQSEESLCFDLERVIRAIATHPDRSQMTLLVDTENVPDEEAALILSSVTMNLLLQEELDVSEGPEISLVGQLGEIQWSALLPRIHARISLENENKQVIARVKAENIPSCELDTFSDEQAAQLKPGIWDITGLSEIVHFNRGIALHKQGKFAEAVSSYQKALEIKPDFAEARYYLSIARYQNQVILKGYQFTQDWFSHNVPIWEQHLKHFINIPTLSVLEIGSWEGRSTSWLLDNILTHDSNKITCIDTFEGSFEHKYDTTYVRSIEQLQSIEERFDFNIARTGVPEKVQKFVGKSQEVLRTLTLNSYDIVYIDGSHVASDVIQDAVLVWQLVKPGGFIIFDDYFFTFPQNTAWNTRIGIDAFMMVFSDNFRLIHKAHQVIIEKTS